MPAAWFLAPYQRLPNRPDGAPARGCVFGPRWAQTVWTDGGQFAATEILGDNDLIKVSASAAVLTAIAGDPDILRIPVARLGDPLSTLGAAAKTAILNKLLALGYTQAEINARIGGDLGAYTLGDVLRFVCQRARHTSYDAGTDTITLDGPLYTPVQPAQLDAAVT